MSRTKNAPLLHEADFLRGEIERNGEYVTILRSGKVYYIQRDENHPAGAARRTCKTLRRARLLSSTLRNEKPQT